jgi:hypothetical protein
MGRFFGTGGPLPPSVPPAGGEVWLLPPAGGGWETFMGRFFGTGEPLPPSVPPAGGEVWLLPSAGGGWEGGEPCLAQATRIGD